MYKIGPFSFSYHSADSNKKIFCSEEIYLPKTGLIVVHGPSGVGKTTFLHLLKGIIPEYVTGVLTGEILFNEKNLKEINFNLNFKKIVYLFQNPFSQMIHKNPLNEFCFSLENFQVHKDNAYEIKNELAEKFKLSHLWNKNTNTLSHGECQKLLLASLLALSPEVLLLDEPAAFLDNFERENFYQVIAELKKNHLIVMVDHHLKEVVPITDIFLNIRNTGEVQLNTFPINLQEWKKSSGNLLSCYLEQTSALHFHLKDLQFSYKETPLLINIHESVLSSGEIVVIKGRNGTGKSTFLKLLAGFLPSKKGSITLYENGKIISGEEFYKQIGIIFQSPESSFLFDTLKEELGNYDFGFSQIELDRSPYLFSEGEKRRISIYSSLAQNKNILLYDEPTFGQDQNNIEILAEVILTLKKMNKLQIIISHDEDFIEKVADRFFIINEGDFDE